MKRELRTKLQTGVLLGMSNGVWIPVTASASPTQFLDAEVAQLAEHFKTAFPTAQVVLPAPGEVEENWSRTIKMVPPGSRGWVEVEATWAKGADKAKLEVSTASRGKQVLAGATLIPALIVGVLGYQHPEWLPFFSGLRAFFGAMIGLLAGFAVVIPIGLVFKVGEFPETITLEQQINAVIEARYGLQGVQRPEAHGRR